MATNIVIQHLSGSKVHERERFPLDGVTELTIGRDPAMAITFDAMRDDTVSRRHAVIKLESTDPLSFTVNDLGSSNGTFVNGRRIDAPSELLPEDTIELGAGGPKFSFDLDPRPMLPNRTVQMGAGLATKILGSQPQPSHATTILPPHDEPRPTIGRNTVMRMLTEQRHSHLRVGMYALAGVLVVVGAVGGLLYHKSQTDVAVAQAGQEKVVADLNNTNKQLTDQINQQKDSTGMSPQEIASKFGNATVMISMQWRLYDRNTGKPLFHKTVANPEKGGPDLPAYVEIKGHVYRWLTTDDESGTNKRVGAAGTGTGFVVSEDGLIYTNKHVAAGWKVNYNNYASYEHVQGGQGALFYVQPQMWDDTVPAQAKEHAQWKQEHKPVTINLSAPKFEQLVSWQPEEGGPVFANREPVVISNGDDVFEGRDEELQVRFPGSRVDVGAHLIRASEDADAALIKIDTAQKLSAVTVAKDDTVSPGQKVIVLGYPAFSEQNVAVFKTRENGENRTQEEVIPEPTVTTGIISNISQPTQQAGNVTVVGTGGDVYQMSLASGAGNSGGPVFDGKGQVIGLFTYGNTANNTVTYAVPIRYARDLMQMQRM
jgi:serine protease Do